MTLDQLRAIVEVSRAGSFTQAAKSLHRAQSAVTYAIKKLESELNIKILDRSGYRASFTPAGKTILKKAEQMLELANEVKDISRAFGNGWEPRVNIVVHGILPIDRIMPLLKESMGLDHPTQISLSMEILSGVTEKINNIQPDLVITPLAGLEVSKNYTASCIGSIRLIPVVSRDHPLSRLNLPVSVKELRQHIHLIVSDSAVSPKPVDFMLIDADQCWSFPDFYSQLEGIRNGLGFAWMPTYMIEEDLKCNRLAPLIVQGRSVHKFDISIMHRQSPKPGPASRFLVDLLQHSQGILPDVAEDILSTYPKSEFL
jgi:DNA-binding transcriptional LysR family regulator